MTKGMLYKTIFILSIIVISVLLILPTMGTKQMEIRLADSATAENIETIKNKFSGGGYTLTENGMVIIVSGTNITDAIMNELKNFQGISDVKILKHWVERVFLAKKINLGLDLQGGMYLSLQANFAGIEQKLGRTLTEADKTEITQQALELLRNRIDKFGVSEPSIRPRGNEAIEIQLPGVKDPAGVKKAIGTTGSLEYRLVDDKYSDAASVWFKENFRDKQIPDDPVQQKMLLAEISKTIALPDTMELLFYWERDKNTG
ncbi:MAG TPA: hypothetical protein PK986_11375, partial [Spirochaetota bacterium]|nr:hypothetical protein [Spirochaetota bacterium]